MKKERKRKKEKKKVKEAEEETNLWSTKNPITHMITRSTSSRKCTRQLSSFNYNVTSLLHFRYKLRVQPDYHFHQN